MGTVPINRRYFGTTLVHGESPVTAVDLGAESANGSDLVGNARNASASVSFNTDGTVTLSATGDAASTSAPATDWDTNGGQYLSYELIDEVNQSADAITSISGSLPPSTAAGENRQDLSATAFGISADSAWLNNGEALGGEATLVIKVSIWDSASSGNLRAFGNYTATAFT